MQEKVYAFPSIIVSLFSRTESCTKKKRRYCFTKHFCKSKGNLLLHSSIRGQTEHTIFKVKYTNKRTLLHFHHPIACFFGLPSLPPFCTSFMVLLRFLLSPAVLMSLLGYFMCCCKGPTSFINNHSLLLSNKKLSVQLQANL